MKSGRCFHARSLTWLESEGHGGGRSALNRDVLLGTLRCCNGRVKNELRNAMRIESKKPFEIPRGVQIQDERVNSVALLALPER